ncbi:hypothetical protein BsWGS_17968 [Bradybaena similaris]
MNLLLLLLAVAATAVLGENSYVVVSPAKIRPDMDLTISVDIVRATGHVTVTATVLKGTILVATAAGSFQAGSPGTLTVKMPSDLTDGSYTLKIDGSGGLTFTNSTNLAFSSKQTSVFVQTDKAIYKPGDVVNWRAFATDSDLKLFTGNLNISIHDAGGNKIKQWLQETPTEGVVTRYLSLSSQPVLGDWKIRVDAANSNTEKVFTVAEYVLPKFEVSLTMPSYVLTTENEATFTVKVKYTYGKPLKGAAVVSVGLLRSYNHNDPSKTEPVSTVQVQVDGEAKVSIPLADVKKVSTSLDGHFLFVRANVSESLTGNTMSAESKVKMHDKGVILEFPTTNPTTFKPGLRYTAYLKVSQPDGLPVLPSNKKVKVSINLVHGVSKVSPIRMQLTRFPIDPTETVTLPEAEFELPANGMIEIPLDAPANTRSATIRAEFQGVSASLSLGKSASPSNSYIQLLLETSTAIQAGDAIAFRVKATYALGTVVYQVLSRGKMVKSGSINANGQTEYAFSITSDSSMAPRSRIVAYHVRADGEIVTDSISFEVNGAFKNKVAINIDTAEAEPGQEVKVTVRADPSSSVHILAIDQSVLLLKSGNDVTPDDVYQELESYGSIDPVRGIRQPFINDCINCWRRKRSIIWPWPVFTNGKDAKDVFDHAGVVVITDNLVYDEPIRFPPIHRNVFFRNGAVAVAEANFLAPQQSVNMPLVAADADLKEPVRTRTVFDETWLWMNLSTGADGTASIKSKVRDSMTSWVASCFAVNSGSGLGVAPTQAKLRVFRPFFVSLNLPYSVTRGEKLVLQAIVFNYMQEDMRVRVTLARSDSFSAIIVDTQGQEKSANEDTVRDVLAEGVSKDYNVAILIDLTEGKNSFSHTVNLSLPANVVNGSQRARISAVGDLMGPTISGLDSLLQMPTGCGEQNMLTLAPDVYVTDYLMSVNQLTSDIKAKALSYMESGYQRELTYKHKDGSFSAFGESDTSGSMWLTAFVVRAFHQAKPFIFIDDQVMSASIRWIIGKQTSDGSFPEPGRVIHTSMQGNAAGGTALTLFVLICLLENKDMLNVAGSNGDQAIAKAVAFAESQVASSDDLYILALASYAFQLANSGQAQAVLTKLEAKATNKDGLMYWHHVQPPKTSTSSWENPNPTQAIDTEITAYVLLTYVTRGEIAKAKSIVQWLVKQRNPHGGYQSTQDTVVALLSMSQFAKKIFSKSFNMKVTATLSPTQIFTFNIDQTNALVLQTQETRVVPSKVKFDAEGSGIALVEVAVFFNVESDIEAVTFDLTVKLVEETMNYLVVETCTKWLGEGKSSGMAVEEFGIPSGFEPDLDSISQLSILKRIETQNKKVILYFDEISTTQVCLHIRVVRTGLVAKSQPAPVRVYDYYNPNNQVTSFYQSQLLKGSSVCDICKDCDNCAASPK